jgi:hypothetical protein
MRLSIAVSLALPSAAMLREVVSGETAEASSTEQVELKLSESGIGLISQSSRFRPVRAAGAVITAAARPDRSLASGRPGHCLAAVVSGHRLSNGLLAPLRL